MFISFTLFIGSSWVTHILLMSIKFVPLHRGKAPLLLLLLGHLGSAVAVIF